MSCAEDYLAFLAPLALERELIPAIVASFLQKSVPATPPHLNNLAAYAQLCRLATYVTPGTRLNRLPLARFPD
jgi:hypothetical protein